MPNVRKTPLAILVSDLHLSHKPPKARAAEPDWYQCMSNQLEALRDMAWHWRASNDAALPIICAGDVFDRWNSPPELINFAIDNLPTMWALPGQHDLPQHRLEAVEKSAYQTLVKAGNIKCMVQEANGGSFWLDHPHGPVCAVFPFAWGQEVTPIEAQDDAIVRLAVVHAYCWSTIHKYTGAPEAAAAGHWAKKLGGYTAAHFGDNHKGFLAKATTPCGVIDLINTGGFMPRKIDEAGYWPWAGVLWSTGEIYRENIGPPPEEINWVDTRINSDGTLDMSDFLSELKAIADGELDFVDAVHNHLNANPVHPEVRALLISAIDGD